jgi:hypothetical protein
LIDFFKERHKNDILERLEGLLSIELVLQYQRDLSFFNEFLSDYQFEEVLLRLLDSPHRETIKRINLDYNALTRIPQHFDQISNQLLFVSLIKNDLTSFPIELCNIPSLE